VKFSIEMCGRLGVSAVAAVVLMTMTACATRPAEIKIVEPPSYSALMASADEAGKNGSSADSLTFLEQAAKAEPAKKQPWLRIAQIHFDAHVYGAAITAAQEVLQRDNADVTAKSILAASGLRVSANALEQLRAVGALGGGTRDEAQALARIMRDALGESILPTPVTSPPAPPKVAHTRKQAVRATPVEPTSPSASSAPPAMVAPAKTPPAVAKPTDAPESKRNPFTALKG